MTEAEKEAKKEAERQAESDRQDEVRKFVDREVIYCVSNLIHHMAQKDTNCELLEEFPDLFQGAPTYGTYTCPECFHTWDGEPGVEECDDETCKGIIDSDESEEFEPTEFDEIFEHWIVSDHLARKLGEKGESIETDFYGLTIWGRSCTGQAILLDGVINEIYKEMKG